MIAKRREGIWFLVGAGKFGYTEGYKSKFTRSELLIQYPWGMHICDYQQKKKRYQPGLRRGMPSAFHVKMEETQ